MLVREGFNQGFQEFQEICDKMKGKQGKTYCWGKKLKPFQGIWDIPNLTKGIGKYVFKMILFPKKWSSGKIFRSRDKDTSKTRGKMLTLKSVM